MSTDPDLFAREHRLYLEPLGPPDEYCSHCQRDIDSAGIGSALCEAVNLERVEHAYPEPAICVRCCVAGDGSLACDDCAFRLTQAGAA